MSEKEARLQGNEDVETGGFSTEEDEFGSSVYLLEGKVFSISKESQETVKMLSEQIREALPDTGQRATDMERIVDRVQTLMSTNFRDIKGAKKLKDKVKGPRTNIRHRITELSQKILPMVEAQDPARDEVEAMMSALNETTVAQRLMMDGAALTLILRRDMATDETIVDVARRKDRIEVANSLIQQARVWVSKLGPGEGSPRDRLRVLGSAGVTDVDVNYDTSVVKLTEVDDQEEQILRQLVQDPVQRVFSPDPSKRPMVTSTPHNQNALPMSPQAITRIGRTVSLRVGGITDENALSEEEITPRLRIQDPTGPKQTLRAHEEEYFRLQNQSQTELPLFPDKLTGYGATKFHTAHDQTLKSSLHGD